MIINKQHYQFTAISNGWHSQQKISIGCHLNYYIIDITAAFAAEICGILLVRARTHYIYISHLAVFDIV